MCARELVACSATVLIAGSVGCGASHIEPGHGSATKAGAPAERECADVPNGIPTPGKHAPFAVVDTQQDVYGLTVDADYAYWVVPGDGVPGTTFRIMRAPLSGGAPVELTHAHGDPWMPLALDDTRVYWATPGYAGERLPGTVGSVSKDGGAPEILYSDVTYINTSWLVVDDGFVYWTDFERIQRIAKRQPGSPETLVASSGQGIAEDATSLYWADYGKGKLGSIAKDGNDSLELELGFGEPRQVMVSCGRVFFNVELQDLGLYTWDVAAGEVRRLSDFVGAPFPVDSRYAYTGFAGLLYRVDLETGAMEVLDDTTMGGREIAVNDTHVYWTSDATGGVIWGLEK